ncbi:protein TRI1 isoform X2 [Arabidopsis lyrata subsp. lyrata]|uniref:protein TRI1 isoform X2 n=1 Tax=Arabidopsis lyrata subsp. lyrata TaxID=81972 RepID=UPI000A29E9BE|nr:protein TRI1 isoform X2 [Arabidopsis lyrata subsp. lyrata]|eukprot:XP_020866725.1 protein TRI1 isoform X2 [Arabidopsis lyrata subsp. lyrata]
MVSDSDLVTQLREILRSSDLETTTPASVRRQLEAYFGVELTDKKAFVREQIDAFLESEALLESKPEEEEEEDNEDCNGDQNDEEGSENDDDKTEPPVKAKKRGGGFNKICQLSPQLEKFLGTSQLARTEVVKKMWAYIRQHDLQDPKNRRNILCDDSLHSLFRVKTIDMFQMNKALAKHIWPLNDGDGCVKNVKGEDEDETSGERYEKEVKIEEAVENNEEVSGEEEDRSVRKRKRKKRKPAKSEEKPKKKGGGFTKVCSLSPELQAFTGTAQLARTEVVRMLWKYIKENNLQDPSDKRTIICDESLRSLFPVESINMFQMNKQLTKHIWPLVQEDEGTTNDSEKGKQKMKMEIDADNDEANDEKATSSRIKTEQ